MSKNSPEQVKLAGSIDISVQNEILNPIAVNEIVIPHPGDATPNPAVVVPDPVVINNISEHPKTDKLTATYILNTVSNNMHSVFKNAEEKLKSGVAERVGEGLVDTGAQLRPVAIISKYAITGLCIAGVSTAASAWPAMIGLAAISVILAQVSTLIKLNRELEEMILIVNSQIQRIHNIYCVIEEVSNENRFPINTEMIKKYLIIILSNILLISGRDTYKKIVDGLQMNPSVKDLQTSVTPSVAPGHSQAVGASFFQYLLGKKKVQSEHADLNATKIDFERAVNPETKNSWYNTIMDMSARVIEPKEVLRGISRDLLLLNVYFSILQGEFDLLSREHAEHQKREYFTQLELAEKEPSIETKVAKFLSLAKLQNKANVWPNGETYKKFFNQLPKSNMAVFMIENSTGQTLEQIVSGKSEVVPASDGVSPSKVVFKPQLKEMMERLDSTKRSLNLSSLDSAPSPAATGVAQRGPPPVVFTMKKGGRFTLRKSRNKVNTKKILKNT